MPVGAGRIKEGFWEESRRRVREEGLWPGQHGQEEKAQEAGLSSYYLPSLVRQ